MAILHNNYYSWQTAGHGWFVCVLPYNTLLCNLAWGLYLVLVDGVLKAQGMLAHGLFINSKDLKI